MQNSPKPNATLDSVVVDRRFKEEHADAFLGWDLLQKYVHGDTGEMSHSQIADGCGRQRREIGLILDRAFRKCREKSNPHVL